MSDGCGCPACGRTTVSVGPKGDPGATGETGPQGEPGEDGLPGGAIEGVILATLGELVLTEGQTGGRVIFDRATGVIATLPSTPEDGTNFDFQVKTDLSSNNYVINAGTAGLDSFNGFVYAKKAATVDEIFATTTGTAITLNGTTKGGDIGTIIHVVYSATENKWYVSGYTNGSGALITPFS